MHEKAHRVAVRRFDLYYLGAEISQLPRCEGSGDILRQIDDADILQQTIRLQRVITLIWLFVLTNIVDHLAVVWQAAGL
jgi:hypothetical protein